MKLVTPVGLLLCLLAVIPVRAQDAPAPPPPAESGAAQVAPSGFDRFQAMLGVDDGALGRAGTVRFMVQLDDKEVFRTDVMRPGDPARLLDLPLHGAHALRLIVDDAGDGHGGDWGDWADARLVNSQTGETLFLSDLEAIVEQEWIATRLDRNLVQDPLRLNGKVYARGLGADSGSTMLYSNLDRLAETRRTAEFGADSAGQMAWGPVTLHGTPGPNTHVLLNGADITADLEAGHAVPYPLGATLQLRADRPPPGSSLAGAEVVGTLTLQGRMGARLALLDVVPARIQTLGTPAPAMEDEPPITVAGQPYYGAISVGQPTLLTYRLLLAALDAAVAIPRVLKAGYELAAAVPGGKRAAAEWRLRGQVGLDNRRKTRFGLVRFRLFADDRLIWQSRPLTPATPPENLDIPFPHPVVLRLEVDSAGDGIYHDEADWADLRLTDPHNRLIAYLEDFRPFAHWQNWGQPQRDLSAERGPLTLGGKVFAHGLGVAANSIVLYRDLDQLVSTRQRAAEAVASALTLAPSDPQKAAAAAEQAVALAPELASVYSAQAQLAQMRGDTKAERAAWQRLIDVAAASPEEQRHAQQEIARLEPALSASLPSPASTSLAVDSGRFAPPSPQDWGEKDKPIRDGSPQNGEVREAQTWGREPPIRIALHAAQRPFLALPSGAQQGEQPFEVESADAGKWLTVVLDSRGLEIAAYIAAAGQPQKPLTAVITGHNPTVRWRTQPGRYLLIVAHDPGKDDFRLDWEVGAVTALTTDSTAPPKPTERWRYTLRNDGSVAVTVTVNGPTVLLLPRTAEMESAAPALPDTLIASGEGLPRALLLPSAFAYGSALEEIYQLGDGLLMAPGPGQTEATVSFLWPDGAYDVPMSHYAPDHAHKQFFAGLRGINPEATVEVTVVLPPEVTKVTRTLPEASPVPPPAGQPAANGQGNAPSGPIYHWTLAPDKSAYLDAENPQLDTKWISAKHRNMTIWMPDCAEYRRWLPDYAALNGRIYDRESALMGGYETQEERLIYVAAPAQLSGYGGATWGDLKLSETWIPCDGHVGPYNLLAQPGGDGVEAHELKWVHLGGAVPDLPRWLQDGLTLWLEEQGKLAGGTGFADFWTWTELAPKAAFYEATYGNAGPGAGFLWMDAQSFGKLPSEQKSQAAAMDWRLCQVLQNRFGDTFWPRFWQQQRRTPDAYKNLDEAARTAKVVADMIALTGDPILRSLFRALGFRLPSPPSAP